MMKSVFSGTYELISWKNTSSSGEQTYPFGPNAKGFITYTSNGYVSVHLMAESRAMFTNEGIFDALAAEALQNQLNYISYFGTFTATESTVFHRLLSCSFPNWEGTTQVRNWSFQNGLLQLSVDKLLVDNELVSAQLIWQPLS
ncbi:hypothetical protein SOPP22_05885 [Shewanella sp. OPT22]|nr:hypothetical protein SOPP22_05885 [Shewanella sp. OPT22]